METLPTSPLSIIHDSLAALQKEKLAQHFTIFMDQQVKSPQLFDFQSEVSQVSQQTSSSPPFQLESETSKVSDSDSGVKC